MTGAITTNSTFDGRDVATDGAKLDGIESGATADQTQSEINALGITATGLSGTPAISVANITTTGELRGPASFTIDPAAVGDNTGTVIIKGNLQVDGATTTINSTTLTVDDLNLTLASGAANGTAANGAGITIDGASATLTYQSTGDNWAFNKNLDVTGTVQATALSAAATYTSIIYGGSSNLQLKSNTAEMFAEFNNNGNAELYYDNSKKFETTNTGINVTGSVVADEIKVGATERIYLDGGSNTYIQESASDDLRFFVGGSQAVRVRTSGTDILGTVTADGLTVDSSGTPVLFTNGDGLTQLGKIVSDATYGLVLEGKSNSNLTLKTKANGAGEGIYFLDTSDKKRMFIEGTTGDISFYNTAGNSQALFWDASAESLGIGTDSPQHKLDVEGGNNVFDLARFGSSASDNSEVTIGYFDANANNGIPALITASDFGGLIQGGEHGHLVLGIRDNDATDALDIVSGGGNFMTDTTYDTLVATFKANGNVGIGTTAPAAKLDITGNNTAIAFTFGNTVPNNPLHTNYYGGYSGIGMDQTTAGVRIAGNSGATATSLDIGYYTSGIVSHANWNSSVMVKNDSKVGIGTQSPDTNLHVYKASAGSITASSDAQLVVENSGVAAINLLSGASSHGQILFGDSGDADDGQFGYDQTNREFYFKTAGNSTKRLLIDSSGNVGIGTASPDLTLHVDGANGYPATSGSTPVGHIAIRAKNENSSHGAHIGVANASPWGTWIQAQDANNLATTYPLLLNPNGGNVGIGTTNPTNTYGPVLHIRGANPNLRLDGTNSGSWSWISMNTADSGDSRAMGTASDGSFRITNVRDNLDSGVQFAITQAGNVGIGTTNSISRLSIGNPSADGTIDYTKGITFVDTLTSTSNPWVHAAIVTTGSTGYNGNLIFATDGTGTQNNDTSGLTERMRITSEGNVGIGNINDSKPQAPFHVKTGGILFNGVGDDTQTTYDNNWTWFQCGGLGGTYTTAVRVTIPDVNGGSSNVGYGSFSMEVYVSGYNGRYCHAYFSGYNNAGLSNGELATRATSSGTWTLSAGLEGTQGFYLNIAFPGNLTHPSIYVRVTKGGHHAAGRWTPLTSANINWT